MNKHEFDDIIKQKAQQREAIVPEDLWEGIAEERKRRRSPFFWLTLIILFLGVGAVVLNINKKDKVVEIASKKTAKEKNDPINKNENTKKIDNKVTEVPSLNTDDKKDNAITGNSANTTVKKNIYNVNQLTAISNKKVISDRSKNQQLWDQKANDQNEEKQFVSYNNKRNTKGNTKVNTIAGEVDSLTDTVAEEEKIISVKDDQYDNKGSKKINITNAETSSALNETNNNKIASNKKEQSPITSTTDPLLTKKITIVIADSMGNKKANASNVLKKQHDNNKKHQLKIETSITAVSPIQNYKQPLYVKRVLDHTNTHAEFVSNKIKTTVEPGMGFNINLVKNINKKWSIGGGMEYLRITEHLQMSGIETNTNYTIVQRLVNDQGSSFLKADTVSAITKDNTTLNGRNIYHSLSIPLFIRYQAINRKKWSAEITAGVYIDLLRKYHNSTPGKFETAYTYGTESAESKNTIGIDLFAGLHVEKKLSKKYALFAAPGFRFNLSPYKTNNLSFNKKIHKPMVSIGIARYL